MKWPSNRSKIVTERVTACFAALAWVRFECEDIGSGADLPAMGIFLPVYAQSGGDGQPDDGQAGAALEHESYTGRAEISSRSIFYPIDATERSAAN
jgi:hypothetical protein